MCDLMIPTISMTNYAAKVTNCVKAIHKDRFFVIIFLIQGKALL